MNRRPLRPEQGALTCKRSVHGRLRRSQTPGRLPGTCLSASDRRPPLPFRSQNRAPPRSAATGVESAIHTSSDHTLVSRTSTAISQVMVAASVHRLLLYPGSCGTCGNMSRRSYDFARHSYPAVHHPVTSWAASFQHQRAGARLLADEDPPGSPLVPARVSPASTCTSTSPV